MLSRRTGFSLIELLVVIGVISVLVGLTLSAVQKVRAAAGRAKCQANLRQVVLGLQLYHDSQDRFPMGNAGFNPLPQSACQSLGWQAWLLPYLEQQSLWATIAPAYRASPSPFYGRIHTGLGTSIPLFICPADGRLYATTTAYDSAYPALTDYLGVAGTNYQTNDGILFAKSAVRIADVTDGTSNTLIVGERPPGSTGLAFGWWYAGVGQDLNGSCDMILGTREVNRSTSGAAVSCPGGPYGLQPGQLADPCAVFSFWSLHADGANFAFADGSVHFLSYSANPLLPALGTRAGGEAVAVP
jgi:prepilin-type N-terminal cleavage/methylation domain-containing protein/prepilin-type processing-associated H-X9-DG protein